jgi:hypothetical protein
VQTSPQGIPAAELPREVKGQDGVSDELQEGFILPPATRRKMLARSAEVSMEGIRELVDDQLLGLPAKVALRCIEAGTADPRTMLLVLEAMQEGYFAPTKPERDRQRYEQRKTA